MKQRSLAFALLLLLLAGGNCVAAEPATAVESAMRRGLTLVTRAASNWQSNKTCFSCHHQTLPMLAAIEASRAGLARDEAWLQSQADTTHGYFNIRIDDMNVGDHVPGGSTTAGYGLWALSMAGRPPDETTTAVIAYLLQVQGTARLDGRETADLKRLQDARWTTSCKRLPMQGSDVADTVLALIGMKQYATAEQQPAVDRASAAAQAWLKQTPLKTQEDRIWRLWGLHHLEGDAEAKRATRAVIFSAQHDDGGWSQTDDRESDAFSTGQTLFVLRQTGTPPNDHTVQQALDYLLRTQLADGSWRVESHVNYKAQPYFENGDPHGEHQFLSTAATAWATAALAQLLPQQPAPAGNFSSGTAAAAKFGVYEIILTGDGSVANPFDTVATVQFTPPSGSGNAKTVWAFYDGENTWRARVYVSEVGPWRWESHCTADAQLDGKSGNFEAADSNLRGRLLIHPKNPRQWMTEDGRWFLNLNDTSYFLLCTHDGLGNPVSEADFQDYVKDAVDHGITSFRSWAANGPRTFSSSSGSSDRHRWDDLFADQEYTRPNLEHLRVADQRLRWMLDRYPDAYMQFILFPLGKPYTSDESFWAALSIDNKQRIMRYLIARYSAYPGIFWLVTNDCIYTIDPQMLPYAEMHQKLAGRTFPNAEVMAREVGNYFLQHDPWRHPLSTGVARTIPFRFGDEEWATYIHLEHRFDFGAKGYSAHKHFNKPVFLGEDRYEQDHPNTHDPVDMRYFQRRLYWSWLFAGGSANYGGRWWLVHPYCQTGKRPVTSRRYPDVTHGQLVGLDSVKFIRDYFSERSLELSDFEPSHDLVEDVAGATGGRAPKLMRHGNTEFLVYHPHATTDDRHARVQAETAARLRIDLRQAQGSFGVEWYRAEDGQSQRGEPVAAGDWRDLAAPWTDSDVVLRLLQVGSKSAPMADLPRFWRTRLEHIEEAVHTLKKGTMNVLAETPGGRNVYLVTYGAADDRQGTANYNSAVGGRDPFSYSRKDGTQKPVVFLLGPVHGQEIEGIAGLLNLLHVAETGRDLRGRAWDELAANLARCRVLIVPCGSPDARARCPYDSWVGEDYPVHERVGMGTRPDGSNHTWPFVKRIHPMRGAEVSTLGAYWNDNQVNLMHDEWFDPMTPETRAFFRLARDEAPDFIVSLHTHAVAPEILQTAYVPWTVKRTLRDLGDRLQKRYADGGLPHRAAGAEPKEDGTVFPPPYFNLCSALHHACGAVTFVHETPCGIRTPPYPQVNHDQLLDIQMLLYDELFRYAVEHPVNWQPAK